MADSKSKAKTEAKGDEPEVQPLADGYARLRVSYSPDGFRGVRDYPIDEAKLLVEERRATYVDRGTPLGEVAPTGEEFRFPVTPAPDTSGGGDTGSTTAGTSTTGSTTTTTGTSGP